MPAPQPPVKDLHAAMLGALRLTEAAVERQGRPLGIATGLSDFDQRLDGLCPGRLLLLAGRPSMGTTALAVNIAYNVARSGIPVALFSADLSAEDIAVRVSGIQSGVPMYGLLDRRPDKERTDALRAAIGVVADVPLYIDDSKDIAVSDLVRRAQDMKRDRGVGLIVVDVLQMVRRTGHVTAKGLTDYAQVTGRLKALALELDIPVVVTSRVWRSAETNEDYIPKLRDLINYGDIEYDADDIAFVWREAYYLEREEPERLLGESEPEFAQRHAAWEKRLAEISSTLTLLVVRHHAGRIGGIHFEYDIATGAVSDMVY